MARRNKAGNRATRQRRRQRGPQPRTAAPQSVAPAQPEAEAPSPPDPEERPPARTTGSSRPAASVRAARANPRLAVAGPSRLSERAAEEYHYVIRDVRNIGVLAAIMLVVLLVAVVIFTVLKVGQSAAILPLLLPA
jgi:hypothetical protein